MNFYNNCNNCDFEEKDFNEKKCCVKRVEETYCCFPSYYNEEKDGCKKEDKKETYEYPCYEGTIYLCPKKSHCNVKEDKYSKDDRCNKDNHHNYRCHNRCGFCGLFSRW